MDSDHALVRARFSLHLVGGHISTCPAKPILDDNRLLQFESELSTKKRTMGAGQRSTALNGSLITNIGPRNPSESELTKASNSSLSELSVSTWHRTH